MKGNSRIAGAALLLAAWLGSPASAEDSAVVTRDRVNVRGQPTMFAEVITQLRKDETVVVLEEIKLARPRAGEPAEWARIQMPSNTPVWINATFVDPISKTVKARRLNLRAGPGENYSVVGWLIKDAEVKEIRVVDDWMEIEAPTNAYAFVACEFLEKKAPAAPPPLPSVAPKTEPPPEAKPATPPAPAPAGKPPEPAPTPPPAPKDETPAAPATGPPAAPDTARPPEEAPLPAPEQKTVEAPAAPVVREETPLITEAAPAPAPPAKRIVRREGVVKSTVSIQAPTQFELASTTTGKVINYLHPTRPEQKLQTFKGRRVVVTGQELIDPRWPKTPVLDVETIELTP